MEDSSKDYKNDNTFRNVSLTYSHITDGRKKECSVTGTLEILISEKAIKFSYKNPHPNDIKLSFNDNYTVVSNGRDALYLLKYYDLSITHTYKFKVGNDLLRLEQTILKTGIVTETQEDIEAELELDSDY